MKLTAYDGPDSEARHYDIEPFGTPWVEHKDGQLTIGYFGEQTAHIEFTDAEFNQLVEAVAAAREGRFREYVEDLAKESSQ